MNNLKLKSLAAVAVLLSSSSAFAVQVTLVTDALYSSSGTFYNKIKVNTAVYNWDGTTLTQSGGSLSSTQSVGPTPLLTDNTTGMVIDTAANTTTASSYTCTEGTFLGGVGAHGCWNLNLGGDFVLNSSAAYNVGGDSNCINVTVVGDDVSGGPVRGLGTGSGGSCDPQTSAYANWNIALDNTGVAGGLLTIGSSTILGCAGGTTKNAACGNTTYMTLQAIPVPAAVWLFGSGLGLLGLARRRRSGASA
jgi:hypothetical protein